MKPTRLRPVVVFAGMLGCGRPAAPAPPTTVSADAPPEAAPPASTSAPVATAPESDAAPPTAVGGRWLHFDGPPFVDETPMHGGPPWSIAAPGLPARLRSSGTLVLAVTHRRGLSTVPNLALRFLSADGARTERTVEILPESAFDRALEGSPEQKRAAFAALGDVVRARVSTLDAQLQAYGDDFVGLDPCTLEPADPYAGWPPCGADQTLRCGATTFRYLGGRQTLVTAPGTRRTFPAWRKPRVKASDGPPVAVNECIGAAWLDPRTKLLVLSIENLCAAPGDGCSVESDWRFVSTSIRGN